MGETSNLIFPDIHMVVAITPNLPTYNFLTWSN